FMVIENPTSKHREPIENGFHERICVLQASRARSFAISMFASERRIEEFHLNCIQPKSSLSEPTRIAIGFFSAVIFFFVFFCIPAVAGYKSIKVKAEPAKTYPFHQQQGPITIAA